MAGAAAEVGAELEPGGPGVHMGLQVSPHAQHQERSGFQPLPQVSSENVLEDRLLSW